MATLLTVLKRLAACALLAVTACSGEGIPVTTASAPEVTVPTTAAPTTSTSLPTIESCDDVPYRPLVVPARAGGADTNASDLLDDAFSTIPGTATRLWVDADSSPVMALVRGALPPEPWGGPTARVEVMRQFAALGPLSDGVWAVAWFEGEEQCDLYMLVLYPPTSAEEALEVAESLIPDR